MNSLSPLDLPDRSETVPGSILGSLTGPAAETAARSAMEKRSDQPLLPLMFSAEALLPQLPFPFPNDPTATASPKPRYRSAYRYPGPAALLDPNQLKGMSDFEIALHLVDFSPLRDELAQIYRPSRKGQVPFDPVSLVLCACLREEKKQGWGKLSSLLAGEEGAHWRELFGFQEGVTPSASGLRYFFGKVGHQFFTDLCPRIIDLLRHHRLSPERSTFPGDPEDRGVTLSHDGMLHEARSRPSCQLATEECYQPLPLADGAAPLAPTGRQQLVAPQQPPVDPAEPTHEATLDPKGEVLSEAATAAAGENRSPAAPRRPCRAREKGLEGCACLGPECAQHCRRASQLDPQARFIHYEKRNNRAERAEGKSGKGEGLHLFGYRSIAFRVIDDRFAIAWTLRSRLYPADTDERTIFVLELMELRARFPDLNLRGEILADSGVGYAEPLDAIWELGALRLVDIRHDKGDEDFESCLSRGYDGRGRPLCHQGYPMSANGHDYDRRRTKWTCNQVCRREPLHPKGPVAPPQGCPYLDRPLGQVRNVGRAFPNGSVRLAREVPYGSPTWKARYGRRNLSESRNGQLQMVGLKRMRLYGLPRNEKEVQLADFLLNLRTLGRLVRETTRLHTK